MEIYLYSDRYFPRIESEFLLPQYNLTDYRKEQILQIPKAENSWAQKTNRCCDQMI